MKTIIEKRYLVFFDGMVVPSEIFAYDNKDARDKATQEKRGRIVSCYLSSEPATFERWKIK